MVFNWSLSDSKSLQISRTFLRILADVNKADKTVFWFLSLLVYLPSLWELFRARLLQLVSLSPSCSIIFFRSQLRSWYSFHVLLFLLCDQPIRQSPLFGVFSFFTMIIIIVTLFRVFHTSISRWFLTGVSVTAILLNSPENVKSPPLPSSIPILPPQLKTSTLLHK